MTKKELAAEVKRLTFRVEELEQRLAQVQYPVQPYVAPTPVFPMWITEKAGTWGGHSY